MQIINRGRAFEEEMQKVTDYFPYLAPRLEAVKTLRDFEHDVARMSNLGRQFAGGHTRKRLGFIPYHVLHECYAYYGDDFIVNRKHLYDFFGRRGKGRMWSMMGDK